MDAVNSRCRALIIMMAGTVLRPAEALGLTADRINFLNRTITVDRQLVTYAGQMPEFADVKTPSSFRIIPVPDSVLAELSWHIANYPPGHDGLVFTDEKGDGIRRSALGHIWRRAAIKAKVTTKRVPHDLRHFAASVLIHQGASVIAVQHHLGHANPTTTRVMATPNRWRIARDLRGRQ